LSNTPEKAEDFTTSEKLTIAAGVADAVSQYFATKQESESA